MIIGDVVCISCISNTMMFGVCVCLYPPTPADSKGERVREERLWTTTNTTTGLGKLSKELEICVF